MRRTRAQVLPVARVAVMIYGSPDANGSGGTFAGERARHETKTANDPVSPSSGVATVIVAS